MVRYRLWARALCEGAGWFRLPGAYLSKGLAEYALIFREESGYEYQVLMEA